MVLWSNIKTKAGLAAFLAAILASMEMASVKSGVLSVSRNFFGVLSIASSDGGGHYLMRHGTTLHGAIAKADLTLPEGGRPKALTYYSPDGAMARSITSRQDSLKAQGRNGTYGVVGLGAGSLACYSQPGDIWRFFEIDQAVIDAANNDTYFNFMGRCAKGAPVILGDARITLRNEAKAGYDVLVIDAFSSDLIPVHHHHRRHAGVSFAAEAGRHHCIPHQQPTHGPCPVVAANMAEVRKSDPTLAGIRYVHVPASTEQYITPSIVVLMSRDEAALRELASSPNATPLSAMMPVTPWTDDYSNILSAILLNLKR